MFFLIRFWYYSLTYFFLSKCREEKFNNCISNSSFSPDRTICEPCPEPNYRYFVNSIGECEECPEGEFPNNFRDSCHQCQPNQFLLSFNDQCKNCSEGFVPSDDRKFCKPCPSTQFAEGGKCKPCADPVKE